MRLPESFLIQETLELDETFELDDNIEKEIQVYISENFPKNNSKNRLNIPGLIKQVDLKCWMISVFHALHVQKWWKPLLEQQYIYAAKNVQSLHSFKKQIILYMILLSHV